MENFHLHPITGVVSKCKSQKGKCPFGGESGAENHFKTREEALQSFEKLMKASTITTVRSGISVNDFPVDDVRNKLGEFIEKLSKTNPEAAYAVDTFLKNLEDNPLPNTINDLNREMFKKLPAGSGGLRQALNFNKALYKAYENYQLELSGLKINY